MSNLYKKHFLKLFDSTPTQFTSLLTLAAQLKVGKKNGKEVQKLTGKDIAFIFEKDSTHIRCSFEAATFDQGARVTYLGPSGSQIGHKESIKDTARILRRMYDGIQYRGHSQEVVETLAQYAGVSVWNGLTNELHPTQLPASLITIQEHLPSKAFNETTLVYADDARNSIGNSMLEAAVLIGLDLRLLAPKARWPEENLVAECSALVEKHGGKITLTEDVAAGVKGADFIYTDVWAPMSEAKEKWAEWIALLCGHQVNAQMMALTDNPNMKFLRCLLVFHDDQTTLGKQMAKEFDPHSGMEVTDEVSESAASIVFDQAENRMYTTKMVMMATLGE